MSDLGWKADGIERAVACGGIALETYRRPGFTGGKAVRRADMEGGGSGGGVDRWHYPDMAPDIEIIGRRDPGG